MSRTPYAAYTRRSLGQMNRNRRFEIGVSSAIARDMLFDDTVGAPVKRCVATDLIVKGDLAIEAGETFYLVEARNPNFKNWFYLVVERDGNWFTSATDDPQRTNPRLIGLAQAHKATLGKQAAAKAS